jgi:branched-chain amino acid aminotransferase
VTRKVVMELAEKRGLAVRESLLVVHDLYVAEEVFATGTAAEIVPIVSVNKRMIGDGKPGTLTKQLTQDFVAYRSA